MESEGEMTKEPLALGPIEKMLTDVYELTLSALTVEGAHHKQYYLEQILCYFTTTEGFEDLRKTLEWERGIAPWDANCGTMRR